MIQIDGKKYCVLGLEESLLSKWLYYPRQSTVSTQPLLNQQWLFSQNLCVIVWVDVKWIEEVKFKEHNTDSERNVSPQRNGDYRGSGNDERSWGSSLGKSECLSLGKVASGKKELALRLFAQIFLAWCLSPSGFKVTWVSRPGFRVHEGPPSPTLHITT